MSEESQEPTAIDDNAAGNVRAERLRQYVGAFVASLGGFALGVSLGWNSSTSEVLKNILNATTSEIGIIGGILNLGACIGLLILPYLLKFISRTGTMFLTIPVLIIGWACICFADQMVSLFILGRLLCGICGGMFCVLSPVYIAEIAEKEIRGRLLTIFQLLINMGVMFAYGMAEVVQEENNVWRYSVICSVTTALIALVNFLPESPMFHLNKGDEERARKSMLWYRGEDYDMETEMEEFRQLVNIRQSKQLSLSILKNKNIYQPLLISFMVMVTQQFSGINTLIFYTLAVFTVGGSGDLSGSTQCLIVGAVQIVSCALPLTFIDIWGRRLLLTMSSTLMGLCLVLLGWFYKVQDDDPEYADTLSWMPLTWMSLFFAAFNFGVGPISWALLGEIFPVEVKVEAAASSAFFSWLMSLIITLSFGEIIDGLGTAKTMWLFAVFCWVGAVFCAVFFRETKGKSLAKIQEDFGYAGEPEPDTIISGT